MNALAVMHPLGWVILFAGVAMIGLLVGCLICAEDLDDFTDCPQCGGWGFLEDHGFGWELPRSYDHTTDSGITVKWCPGCSESVSQ